MDNRELTSAANALIGWFNDQELSKADAILCMNKVIAKILVAQHGTGRDQLTSGMDRAMLDLAHEINERAAQVFRGHADGSPLVPPKRRGQ